ncbi:hypothetical protein MBT84_29725 [Streptomyces sp. MBT84]|nr:hypothetical protein [Streptomyces sp. MBT84]
MQPAELGHGGRHEVPHGDTAGGYPYDAAVAPGDLRQSAQREIEAGHPLLGRLPEHTSGARRHDSARLPLHEADPHLALQPPYVLTDGGLGAPQLPGRGAEASGPADGDEDTQIIEGHGHQGSRPADSTAGRLPPGQTAWVLASSSRISAVVPVSPRRGKIRSTLPRWASGSASAIASVASVTW